MSDRAPTPSASGSAAPEAAPDGACGEPVSTRAPLADAELDDLFAPLAPFKVLILAVSGGADSSAMMHLVARWAELHPDTSRTLVVATVDHGLRAESRQEAEWVGAEARALGLTHEVLTWQGEKPSAGLQDAARSARYRLLSDLGWRKGGAGPVGIVTAHTEDDQAETFLMRLARGSGLDGLTGMSVSRILRPGASCRLLRPLLGVSGARLKATLEARGLSWIEDPSNDCDRFERVRLRKARAHLEALGLTNAAIALSAHRLERARAALEATASELESAVGLDVHGGMFASFDALVFHAAPEELRLRVLTRLIAAFGGQDAPARLVKLESCLARLSAPTFAAATLGGCIVSRHADEIRVFREPARAELPQLELAPGAVAVWDRRFRVGLGAPAAAPVLVRALGRFEFAQLRRDLGEPPGMPPAGAAATLPAFWQDEVLIAVPSLFALMPPKTQAGRHCSAEFLW
ncbi:MAG TPA: tRNA lysidine(34) synthetase TilS [Hyphomicrobium sp.]